MSRPRIPKAIRTKAKAVTGKRSRIVVDHILQHGSITTEDLENYGYKHAPRAIRDVREQGLPLERFWTKNSTGRKIAGYRFGSPEQIRHGRLAGRQVLPKKFHLEVCDANDSKCGICRTHYASRYLQLDHRVPYEISGEPIALNQSEFMPLCGSCNRAKSWSCENCKNWKEQRDSSICQTCYWASPAKYSHIAMREIRRLELVWDSDEVKDYDQAATKAKSQGLGMPAFVKKVLKNAMTNQD